MSQVSGGTVAAQVSAFQSPRKMCVRSPAQIESVVISDRERHPESEIGLPIDQPLRDDIKGMRGGVTPSVNTATFALQPWTKGENCYSLRLPRSDFRPATSFGPWNSDGAADLRKNLRPHRSLENISSKSETPNELLIARSRLKPVGATRKSSIGHAPPDREGHTSEPMCRHKTNSSVLDELDDLLDNAIVEQAAQSIITDFHQSTDKPPPHKPLTHGQSHFTSGVTRSRQARQQRGRGTIPEKLEAETSRHKPPQSIDAGGPRSSSDMDRAERQSKANPTDVDHKPPGMQRLKKPQDDQSPVKNRAALFERLSEREVPHVLDPLTQICVRKAWPRKVESTNENAGQITLLKSLQHSRQRFRHGVSESIQRHNSDSPLMSSSPDTSKSTQIPPIPLTLPQLVSPRPRSKALLASSHSSYVRDPQSEYSSISTPVVITGNAREESPPGRGMSLNWPFMRELSKKSPLPAEHSGIAARALPDHHTSAKKTHETQHRVHHLLIAANEAAKVTENQATEEQKESMSSPEQAPYSDFDHKNVGRPESPPLNAMPSTLSETPRGGSLDEKELANSPVRSRHGTRLQASKTEKPAQSATPSSPVRGRRKMQDFQEVASSVQAKDNTVYAVEQKFALNRSRSRGGGVRVHIEIRSPKASPERNADGGDHIVTVTANVEPTGSEGDGADRYL